MFLARPRGEEVPIGRGRKLLIAMRLRSSSTDSPRPKKQGIDLAVPIAARESYQTLRACHSRAGWFFPPDQYEHDQAMEDSNQSRPPDSAQLSRQRVSSSEIVRRHFFLKGKDFLPRLRNMHRQLTSSVSASTSAVDIPLEDLDYVRTIRPWQNKTSKRPNRTHSGRRSWVGLVDMGLDDIASVP